jgi:hypothetical protein
MPASDAAVPCYNCSHDVDEHDERARCLDVRCHCGWQTNTLERLG